MLVGDLYMQEEQNIGTEVWFFCAFSLILCTCVSGPLILLDFLQSKYTKHVSSHRL